MVIFVRTGVKCDDTVAADLRAKIRKDGVAGPKPDKRPSDALKPRKHDPTTTAAAKQPRKRPIFLDDPSESHHEDSADYRNTLTFAHARQDSEASSLQLPVLPFRSSSEYQDPSTSACSTDTTSAENRNRAKKTRDYGSQQPRLSLPRMRLPNFGRLTEKLRNFWADLDCRQTRQGTGNARSEASAMKMMTDASESRLWE